MQITDHLPNLVGGITQQPPETRIKTAVEEMINAYPSAVQGLSKRRGAQFVTSLTSSALGTTSFMHTIDRDEIEKYFAIINSDGSVEVYDIQGNAQVVATSPNSFSYLATTDPSKNIRAVTAGDYTFLANRDKQVTLQQVQTASVGQLNHSFRLDRFYREQGSQTNTATALVDAYRFELVLGVERTLADGTSETHYLRPMDVDGFPNDGREMRVPQSGGSMSPYRPQIPLDSWTMYHQFIQGAASNNPDSSCMFMVNLYGPSDPAWVNASAANQYAANFTSGYFDADALSPNSRVNTGYMPLTTPSETLGMSDYNTANGLGSLTPDVVAVHLNVTGPYASTLPHTSKSTISNVTYEQIVAWRLNGYSQTFTDSDGNSFTATISSATVDADTNTLSITTNMNSFVSKATEYIISTPKSAFQLIDGGAETKQTVKFAIPNSAGTIRREIIIGHDRVLADGSVQTFRVKYQRHTTNSISLLASDMLATSYSDTDSDGVSFTLDFTGTTFDDTIDGIRVVCSLPMYIQGVNELISNNPVGTNTKKFTPRKVTDFDDLPDSGSPGEIVQITGQTDTAEDDYYVTWSDGRWQETLREGDEEELDLDTMPQALIRQSDGSWTVSPHPWRGRAVGDATANKTPTFVNQKINDLFVFQGRLGFCSGESIALSEVNYFEQFYRSTCVQLEDDNRIDVELRFGRVENIHAALAVQDELILFSDKGQFSLSSGQQTLTPKTVSAKQIGDFLTSTDVRPHTIGKSAFFTAQTGNHTVAREFFLGAATDDRLLSSELTIQCPQYIAGNARYIQASRDHKIIFVLTRDAPTSVYCYKFEYDGQNKIQSAWCKWDLGIGNIESIGVYGSFLYLVSSLGTERELTKIDIRDQQDILGTELLRLDMQVAPTLSDATYYAQGVSGNTTEETRIDIAFDGTDLVEVWDLTNGHTVPIDRFTSGGNLFLKGDYRDAVAAGKVVVGIPYTMDVKLSTLYRRAPKKPQGEIIVTDGRLSLNSLNIAYTDTATFKVEVSSRGRSTKTYYAGPKAGYTTVTFGDVPKSSGTLKVPVMTRNDNADIRIKNDSPFGSTILHVDWFGKHNPHARRV